LSYDHHGEGENESSASSGSAKQIFSASDLRLQLEVSVCRSISLE